MNRVMTHKKNSLYFYYLKKINYLLNLIKKRMINLIKFNQRENLVETFNKFKFKEIFLVSMRKYTTNIHKNKINQEYINLKK